VSTRDDIQALLDLAAAIANKVGTTQATFINGLLHRDALVAEIDGFTFKAEKDGPGVEVVFNKDPFISRANSTLRDPGAIVRAHYGRYDSIKRIPDIARRVGVTE
jgi:hypothetical protein